MDISGRQLLPLVLLLVYCSGSTLSDNATTSTAPGGTAKTFDNVTELTTSVTESFTTKIATTNVTPETYPTSEFSPSATQTNTAAISSETPTPLTTDVGATDIAIGSTLGAEASLDSSSSPPGGATGCEAINSSAPSSGSSTSSSVDAGSSSTASTTDQSGGSTAVGSSPMSTTVRDFNGVKGVPTRRRNYTATLKLSGDCKKVINESKFMSDLSDQLSAHLERIYGGEFRVFPEGFRCGSILVDLLVEMKMSEEGQVPEVNNSFSFSYGNENYTAQGFVNERDFPATTPAVIGVNDDEKRQNPLQETLIYIVIGSVGGSFILLSFFLLCQYLAHKAIKTNRKSSYRPSNNSSIKLSDFNMAHTYIPRPQSIYSATTRSSFLPYEDMDPGSYGGVVSPMPYVYADGDQIREHYQEVVEKGDPVTPTTKTIDDFGRSGIPSWDLPVLEGVVQEEDSASTLKMDERPTSSTFHSPPEVIPPPPETSPPPPPEESSPPSPQPKEEGTTSIKSEDESSHTELSGGDTRHLIRAQNHDVGVDNPALDIDSAYF